MLHTPAVKAKVAPSSMVISLQTHLLRDDDSIQRRATKQLIATNKEVETVVTKNVVLAHTTNFDVVLTRGSEGHGIHIGRKVVGDSHAR
mmetsp:Transcript_2165/g.4522  ORF Transcript_2165/g.4522 Transcript_2165/m.4522 type:complete len:89 (-) Transcript_2165:143-409(-)